ncbi:hypothetical protein LUZ62_053510 [Rhynchospora pubera]|uniref:Dienelactone hydrolase domain-containing protein n=1 Tax=Rhynchospora pubera TaxID=906938 RepID=A0AAV8DSG2_9POAL|nr:hypothetical protein LUZ62_053510 [Rhynchospora pubera]
MIRYLADKVSASGFYVVVPDFLHGDPITPEIAKNSRDEWLKKHGTDKAFEEAKPIIEALKKIGISAIGAAGFCWGAKVVVELAKYDYITAAVLLHPSRVTHDDIGDVKCPISILGAETDHITPPEMIKQFGEILSSKPEVDSHVKIFPGVVHGWSLRYDVKDKTAAEKAEEAHKDMLNWWYQRQRSLQVSNEKHIHNSGTMPPKITSSGTHNDELQTIVEHLSQELKEANLRFQRQQLENTQQFGECTQQIGELKALLEHFICSQPLKNSGEKWLNFWFFRIDKKHWHCLRIVSQRLKQE